MTDDRLTTEDVARYTGFSRNRVRSWMGGEIKAAKIGGRWRTTRREVDSFLERHSHGGALPPAAGKRRRSRYPAQSP